MCLHGQEQAAKVHTLLMGLGTATHTALLIGTVDKEGKSYGTAWYVTVTDRQAIANIQKDILVWHNGPIKGWNWKWVNEKRAQFDLPPLEENDDYEADRDTQPHPDDKYMAKILKTQEWPTERDAEERIEEAREKASADE